MIEQGQITQESPEQKREKFFLEIAKWKKELETKLNKENAPHLFKMLNRVISTIRNLAGFPEKPLLTSGKSDDVAIFEKTVRECVALAEDILFRCPEVEEWLKEYYGKLPASKVSITPIEESSLGRQKELMEIYLSFLKLFLQRFSPNMFARLTDDDPELYLESIPLSHAIYAAIEENTKPEAT